jgi:hypothetical protein
MFQVTDKMEALKNDFEAIFQMCKLYSIRKCCRCRGGKRGCCWFKIKQEIFLRFWSWSTSCYWFADLEACFKNNLSWRKRKLILKNCMWHLFLLTQSTSMNDLKIKSQARRSQYRRHKIRNMLLVRKNLIWSKYIEKNCVIATKAHENAQRHRRFVTVAWSG